MMKKIFTLITIVGLSAFATFNVEAQQGLLRYADRKAEEGNHLEAGKGYEDAFARRQTFRAATGAAEAYEKLREYEKAYEWRKKTITFSEASKEDILKYISATNQAGKKEEVKKALDSLGRVAEPPLKNLELDSLRYWYDNPFNAELVGLSEINTSNAEFGIAMDAEGNTYFSSDRGDVKSRTKSGLRIDKSYRYFDKDSDWTGRDFLGVYKKDEEGNISPFEVPVPDVFHVTDPFFLKEQSVVFYTVTRKIRNPKNYTVQPELFFSRIGDNGELIDYSPFPLNDALSHAILTPFVDESQNRLYFASDMPGGFGELDLYYVEFDEDFSFGEPVNLGGTVNTAGNERDPFLNNDRFYFSSDGHIGLGGLDVFVANRVNGDFSGVKNLGLPYNSPQDDFGFFLSPGGEMFLASNRPGSIGLDDIFRMEELYKRLRAEVLGCDGELINGSLEVLLMQGSEKVVVETDQDGKGTFTAELAPDENYQVQIKRDGYFALKDNSISTKNLDSEELKKSFQLVRIPYQTAVYVDLVYFDLDKANIRKDAEANLDKIGELLRSYGFLDISVGAHTDARASSEYNKALSERRASSVRDYLSKYGISRSRVRAEWFGEEELVNDCGDGVPCPEDKHQLNRRSEMILLAFPEEGKAYDLPPELEGIDLCDISNIQVPMEMPTIHFGFDRSDLTAEEMQSLERVALMLENMLSQRLIIRGHTDNRGSEEYNMKLSEQRAKVVKEYLEGRGIASDRIVYEFFGKSKPIHDCDSIKCTPAMHRLNRRTELSLPELNKDWTKKIR
ncbi:OmpA family protein [Pleomorphovibrio marinus]|uniref:OmpA family protein n=1 Tax=Pleomorphovibrio marinus TaxID=2164132 RepID=UPI0018E5857F|nr:OmpA family protein [Pleomorphovibrio marinus]